jgi:selenocysteine-specific elongation factor
MIVGTAGHIDHGKTSLVRKLTGVDTDRLKEEKARGISIDLGFAYWPRPSGEIIGFVDVPGHEGLVHNMLAGATGIDFVVLVIAATTASCRRRASIWPSWTCWGWSTASSP